MCLYDVPAVWPIGIGSKEGQGKAKDTLTLWMAVLQACLSSAMADELLTVNPAARPGKLGGRAAKPIMVFTVDELAHLFPTCQSMQPESYPLLLLLARTRLRIGEALALQAGDIDLLHRQITVKRT